MGETKRILWKNDFRKLYWPAMTTAEVAQKCVKNAANVAYFVAGATALLVLLAWFDVVHLVSKWSALDALAFMVLGFFISRGSRVAAIIGLTFYMVEALGRIATSEDADQAAGGLSILTLVLILFFVNGIRGAFALARLRQTS